ncbi:hypothetical protein [Lysinibacillus sp. FSL W7-1291]|uniref:hypothetical protein n=1 Tax=Lysinibacillus sp. FSL W7-1291 TaxID=2954544 RepID=UPI003159EBAF
MTSHSISFYINQLKQQIMNNLSGEHIRPLQLYIRKLIEENPNDYTSINDTYLTIKLELVETCHDSR